MTSPIQQQSTLRAAIVSATLVVGVVNVLFSFTPSAVDAFRLPAARIARPAALANEGIRPPSLVQPFGRHEYKRIIDTTAPCSSRSTTTTTTGLGALPFFLPGSMIGVGEEEIFSPSNVALCSSLFAAGVAATLKVAPQQHETASPTTVASVVTVESSGPAEVTTAATTEATTAATTAAAAETESIATVGSVHELRRRYAADSVVYEEEEEVDLVVEEEASTEKGLSELRQEVASTLEGETEKKRRLAIAEERKEKEFFPIFRTNDDGTETEEAAAVVEYTEVVVAETDDEDADEKKKRFPRLRRIPGILLKIVTPWTWRSKKSS